ncbi:MAG: peptide deformylase [Coxiellaceae bacterium]|jgi:peptide deformylase|nr:peptide deformylase [Coxiellaceae bacterium]
MAILKILQYPDLRLRRKGYQVTDVTALKIQTIIDNMTETLLAEKNCAGLAATQLDLEEPPSITVINYPTSKTKKDILCLVNPQIITQEGSNTSEERCMSIRPKEFSAKIKRSAKIKARALDLHGNKIELEATDFLASCIQHEYDHLQGILYIDYLSKLKRAFLERKIAKLAKSG